MKRMRTWGVLLSAVALTAILAGCTKKEGGSSDSASGRLAGTYSGTLTQVSGEKEVTLKITSTGNTSVKLQFSGGNVPAVVNTEVYEVGENEIRGKTPATADIVYHKTEKVITYLNTNAKFLFVGKRQ